MAITFNKRAKVFVIIHISFPFYTISMYIKDAEQEFKKELDIKWQL